MVLPFQYVMQIFQDTIRFRKIDSNNLIGYNVYGVKHEVANIIKLNKYMEYLIPYGFSE